MPAIDPVSFRKHLVTFILTVVNLSIPVFVLLQRNSVDLTDRAYIWVGWISAVLLNVVFLTAMHLRTRRTEPLVSRSSIFIACVLTILSGLITTVSISAFPKRNSYIELAQSGIPLSEIQPERKRLTVELIRRDAANSAENNKVVKGMTPISPPLYSVNSFASKEAMESTSAQFKRAYDADLTYATAKHQAMQDFHDKMMKVDPDYLRDFESRMHDDDVLEASIESAEAQWVTSALNLYDYAIDHASAISADNNGHLVISDQNVRKSLLDQITTSTTLQQTMLSERAKAVNKQHSLQDALRVKHSD
jgi:heme/copper-type cytochrome/quinol oxidase subunit 4